MKLVLAALATLSLPLAAQAHYVDLRAELQCATSDGKKIVLNDLIVGGSGKALHSDDLSQPLSVAFLGEKNGVATLSLDKSRFASTRSVYLLRFVLDSGELTSRKEGSRDVPYVYVEGLLESGDGVTVAAHCLQPLK